MIIMQLDLAMVKEILSYLNHSRDFPNSLFIPLYNAGKDELGAHRIVPSAKTMALVSVNALGTSFKQVLPKSSFPTVDPCGTPHEMLSDCDLTPDS